MTHRPNTLKQFQRTTLIPTTIECILRFHEKPNALKLLTPPTLIVQIIRDQRVSIIQGTVEFILWFGPLPVRWKARHESGPIPTSFTDRMIIGPMARWEHQHIFRTVEARIDGRIENCVELSDKLTFSHKHGWQGWLTRFLFGDPALAFLFWYRHWRTQRACRHNS
jgi:ligand-binding SRPBCC domain-containing protein